MPFLVIVFFRPILDTNCLAVSRANHGVSAAAAFFPSSGSVHLPDGPDRPLFGDIFEYDFPKLPGRLR